MLIQDLGSVRERISAVWALHDYGDRARDAVPALAQMLSSGSKVEFVGLYSYPIADGTRNVNTGEGQSIAIIDGNVATFNRMGRKTNV